MADGDSVMKRLISLVIKYGMKMPKFIRHLGIRLLVLPHYPGVLINYLLHNNDKFEYDLGIAAIMKNEGPYIKEWIEYHKALGVEKFYLYDNESGDNTKDILNEYIQSGIVEYHYFPGKGCKTQIQAYADAVRRYRNKVKWLAVIDIDEFIVPVIKNKIIDVINDLESGIWQKKHKNLHGFAARWVPYGYNGHYKKPEGLVIKNFNRNSGPVTLMKSIVNPRAAFFTAPSSLHTPMYLDMSFGVTETGEKHPWEAPISINSIRVNHYVTKSYEEYKQKILRNSKNWIESIYRLPEYEPNYLSAHEDPIMNKYITLLGQY
ncbi:MAG: glycosyltransferase family 92 protein [Spirochaetaceae bacterium]|nr:glycosyltransferase family 92 protein [Spirochaetaceae bacterium]